MADTFQFELVFTLPEGHDDAFALTDAVFTAGFEDALVGTGVRGLLGVALDADGDDAETVILASARALIRALPSGTKLREVRPDLVSLSDVAEKLHVKRQALQQREMPFPVSGGLYRIDEVHAVLQRAMEPGSGRRVPRFDLAEAGKWFVAGRAARRINARISLDQVDPVTLSPVEPGMAPDRGRTG